MLGRVNRLNRESFNATRWANSSNSAHFVLRRAPSREKKVAVTVSKKISKSAVARNTLRRRTYSAIGEMLKDLPAGYFHLIARSGAEKLRGENLKKEINLLFAKER